MVIVRQKRLRSISSRSEPRAPINRVARFQSSAFSTAEPLIRADSVTTSACGAAAAAGGLLASELDRTVGRHVGADHR